jgi:hypothetical protein
MTRKGGKDEDKEEEEKVVCAGFDENVVLAMKNFFLDSEMRSLVIRRGTSSKYIYQSRTCYSLTRLEQSCQISIKSYPSLSSICRTVPAGPPVLDHVTALIQYILFPTPVPGRG